MSKINIETTRLRLQDFQFKQIFIEELGWSNPENSFPVSEQQKDLQFTRTAIAELSGAVVFEVLVPDGNIPTKNIRLQIAKYIQTLNFENVTIFIDKNRTQSIWHWLKVQDKKPIPREHAYLKGQPGDLFISKLSSLVFDISEFDSEGNVPIVEVAERMKQALDIEVITKKFFKDYQQEFDEFVKYIEGIDQDRDRKWYASVILNRLMFIYFLQRKHFLDDGDVRYLTNKLNETTLTAPANTLAGESNNQGFFGNFLQTLFFHGFALPEGKRTPDTQKLIGKIKYLNGGLFLKHKLEEKYANIHIANEAFEKLFRLFDSYSWNLNDTPGGDDREINPDILGYIFEKYINQKAFGAYYTRTEITEYLCEQTIHKLILDEINGVPAQDTINAPFVDKALVQKYAGTHYETLEEALFNLDAADVKKLLIGENAILPKLTLLDPACGSGAFLIAALKKLIDIYSAVIGKIDFLGNKELIDWKKAILKDHPNVEYYIKKQIITNNLYGVDIMEEAVEIAKLRLFLALVASAHTVDDLEPLPNIDFNIMAGNSLIGLLQVDEKSFDKRHTHGNLFQKSYTDLLREKQIAIANYQKAEENNIFDRDQIQKLRGIVDEKRAEALPVLNEMLVEEFKNLGIKYEQVTWDTEKNKEGKPVKRAVNLQDIENLHPFHWGYEFSKVFTEKGGFDAIITNPPWEIFKPQAKEFFADYSSLVTTNKMNIKEFEKVQDKLLQDDEIKTAYLEYSSRFPYVSLYYRSANQYKNQISIVNGKKAGTDINLYKLFTEQSFNLIRKKGYCGIVIPSGIYTDLGTKQLREMLFSETEITGLFCFENRKEIFEGVDSRFKFVVLSFEKNGKTENFPAAFMRHDVDELLSFPKYNSSDITLDFIKKTAPESLGIIEFKNIIEIQISNKIYNFPLLGSDIWNIHFQSEFHMTNDSFLFSTNLSDFPLFEGKMIHQFTHQFAEPKYWVDEKEARIAILGRTEDRCQKLDYQHFRLGFRKIARSNDERTMISTIILPNFHAENFQSVKKFDKEGNSFILDVDMLYLVAFWNSFSFDYIIRQKVSANINFFYIYQSPIPRLTATDQWFRPIVERAAKLICTTPEFADLWNEVMPAYGYAEWTPGSGATQETVRNQLRAELDGIVANIYGLTEEEFVYVLSTFPLVKEKQKHLTLQEFQRFSVEIAGQSEESQLWRTKIDKKESKEIELKSSLRFCLKEKKVRSEIEHSALKSIAAFLNSEGGELFIGVDDSGTVLGLDDDFSTFKGNDKIDKFRTHFDTIFETAFGNQYQRFINMQFPVVDGKIICVVTVKKSEVDVWLNDKCKAKGGGEQFYIRRQGSTAQLAGKEASDYIKNHWKD
jgi:hypothetical protein